MIYEFLDIDDELFGGPKVKDERLITDYQPKNCTEEWFECDELRGDEDGVHMVKFRADRAFSLANYSRALTLYQEIYSQSLPPQMVRDTTEAIVRCQLHLQQLDQALTLALDMNNLSRNKDHKTCSLMLLARVYSYRKDHSNEMITMANLIQYHPLNINFWSQFAQAFAAHWQVELSTSSLATHPHPCHDDVTDDCSHNSLLEGLHSSTVYHIIGACYVRIRTIHDCFSKHSQTWGLVYHSKFKATTERWLEILPLMQNFKQVATQVMCKDVLGEIRGEESDDLQDEAKYGTMATAPEETSFANDDDLTPINHCKFYAAWFGWLDTFLRENNDQHSPIV